MQSNLQRPNGCLNGAVTLVSSLSSGTQSIAFNFPVGITWRPECESLLWGTPPAVESGVPATGFTEWYDGFNNTTVHSTLTVTLNPPASVFGFEAATEIFEGTGTVTAVFKDAHGNVLGTVSKSNAAPVNNNYGAQLIAASSDTPIASVDISTGGQTLALAQFRVGQTMLQSVEVTQAIQQYQTLSDLKATHTASGGDPIVPIVTGKRAVLRAYIQPLPNATSLKVRLTGVATQTVAHSMPPGCKAANERLNQNCPSFDFYFIPPSGSWLAHLDIMDAGNNVIESHDLNFRSWNTQNFVVRAASVCDNGQGPSKWQCEDASALAGSFLRLVKNIIPSANVTRQVTDRVVRRDSDPYQSLHSGESAWWRDVVSDVNKLYNPSDAVADSAANRRSMYYGMVRRDPFNGNVGGVTLFPSAGSTSHAAAGLASVQRLGNELNFEVLSHETGHTFGVRHTNKGVTPGVSSHGDDDNDSYGHINRDDDDNDGNSSHGTAGCYGFAADSATDWPFADNRIQTQAQLEVGFDVGRKRPLDPTASFENSSYCTPRWISPFNYKKMFNLMTGTTAAPALAFGQFWQISGLIQNSTAALDPLFQFTTTGSTAPGSGYATRSSSGTPRPTFCSRASSPRSAPKPKPAVRISSPRPPSTNWCRCSRTPKPFPSSIPRRRICRPSHSAGPRP